MTLLVLTTTAAGAAHLRTLAGDLRAPAPATDPRAPRPLAYRHRPALTGADRCAALLVTPVADRAQALALTARAGATGTLVRAALGRTQPGLDLWAPPAPAREIVLHEHVTSDPAGRTAYYRDQEQVSAPAMREAWHAGEVTRFVGVEITEHLAGHGTWDVLHLTGLRLRALPAALRWTRRFDRHAQAAGRTDMATVRRDWEQQRTMAKGIAHPLVAA